MVYFGQKLKKLRKAKHVTQKQLGEIIGVKPGTISSYEKSGTYPSVEMLIKLARYFHVSADYLLGLVDATERFDYSTLDDDQALVVMEVIRQFERDNALVRNRNASS